MEFGYNTKLCEMFPELNKKRILFLLRKYSIPHFERKGSSQATLRLQIQCQPSEELCLWVRVLPSAPYAFVTQWKSNRLLTDELLVRAQSKALYMRVQINWLNRTTDNRETPRSIRGIRTRVSNMFYFKNMWSYLRRAKAVPLPCHGRTCGCESRRRCHTSLAQLGEHFSYKEEVDSSSLSRCTRVREFSLKTLVL